MGKFGMGKFIGKQVYIKLTNAAMAVFGDRMEVIIAMLVLVVVNKQKMHFVKANCKKYSERKQRAQ